ncbi:MAG: proprotein convertase P-domain-containing protein [Acidobacteria bacterium]|nr:proprotein convertase P-domain-containing protein [Acidobacteriota bacterium]MBV9475777.1 proprotein convertase P-domain-containing protein [Acidobacteriota bacterium]
MRSLVLALLVALSARADLRLELVRDSLTGRHCRYREYVDNLPTEHFIVAPCADAVAEPRATIASELRLIDGRVARRVIRSDAPLQPYAYDYDAVTGELLRRTPLFFRAKPARVFDPNPVVARNDPSLQDHNDASSAVPADAYEDVVLDDVAESGALRGPAAQIIDRQPPNVAPPDASASLLFDREQDGFEAVNAYFHIDRSQHYLQSLGYRGDRAVVPYAIEVDPHAASGSDNSFFLPSTQPGRGTLFYGDGGTDDAEDADLVVHEYGHAILEWISPGTFSGAFASEARAFSEGFGDYWAFSAHYAQRLASGRDPFCFADWDARCWEDDASQQCGYAPGSDCLRRLDSTKTMADYNRNESSGVEHQNGAIWSSALREILVTLARETGNVDEARRIADTVLIESLFDAPPQPTYAVMAQRLLESDRLLYGRAHAPTICAAMSARGILTDCAGALPRGELTLFQSPQRGLAIPENSIDGVLSTITIDDPRAIASIAVRVDIAHPSRGDLRIELIAPDGTTVLLQPVSLERAADVHATFGRDAVPAEPLTPLLGHSAAGTWTLRVRDLRALDTGTLLSWALLIGFGDTPQTQRPSSAAQRVMIPVVTHVYGVGAAAFRSDVRITNTADASRNATLIFTPSGADGRTDFVAMQASLAPGETLAFDDVVASAFGTTGSGSLEVLGDELLVASRTYAETSRGTFGEQIPSQLESTARGEAPLLLSGLPLAAQRWNLGITEAGGSEGVARVTPPDGAAFDIAIAPFSHVQFAYGGPDAAIEVTTGDTRVVAYLSQIDDASGDAMFIPAAHARTGAAIAPAIDSGAWHSELWNANDADYIHDGLTGASLVAGTAGAFITDDNAQTRIVHDGTSQYVSFAPERDGAQFIAFVEHTNAYRTNVGFVSSHAATAEVIVYDAAGAEVERHELATAGGIAQTPVVARVANGRAVVRFTSGSGAAYASLIDTRSGDATFFAGVSPN